MPGTPTARAKAKKYQTQNKEIVKQVQLSIYRGQDHRPKESPNNYHRFAPQGPSRHQ